jgi:hypothetical protein
MMFFSDIVFFGQLLKGLSDLGILESLTSLTDLLSARFKLASIREIVDQEKLFPQFALEKNPISSTKEELTLLGRALISLRQTVKPSLEIK